MVVVKKLAVAIVATAALTSLAACGGASGTVQSKSSHHDKKGDQYTLVVRSGSGSKSTVKVSSKIFKSCDVGESYPKCQRG